MSGFNPDAMNEEKSGMASRTMKEESGIQCRVNEQSQQPLNQNLAGTILVYVPKPRFSSKYSDVLRSPQKLKLFGDPKFYVKPKILLTMGQVVFQDPVHHISGKISKKYRTTYNYRKASERKYTSIRSTPPSVASAPRRSHRQNRSSKVSSPQYGLQLS